MGRPRQLVGVIGLVATMLTLTALPARPAGATTTDRGTPVATGRRTLTGELEGAPYRVELPERWNGTLILFSHGYFPAGFPALPVAAANRPETEAWLLDRGYALAASGFREFAGFQLIAGQEDQIRLLDWFDATVGRPRRTVAYGQSMGVALSARLAERLPGRIHALAALCGEWDPQGTFDAIVDMHVAVRELLAPGQPIDVVRPSDPAASTALLQEAIERALTTPAGRARLALAASFGNVTGWYTAHGPRPTTDEEWIRQQAQWLLYAYTLGLGPTARADLEPRLGGNPSTNVGVDHRQQLERSNQRAVVERAYHAAGLDLGTDLAVLDAAPRIAADPAARARLADTSVPRGTSGVPTMILHTTGDGGAVPDQGRWYAERAARAGHGHDVRGYYVERGGHCSTNAAEEIVALHLLFWRLHTGSWLPVGPSVLTPAAEALGPQRHVVLDFGTFAEAPMAPAFTWFIPDRFPRPSR